MTHAGTRAALAALLATTAVLAADPSRGSRPQEAKPASAKTKTVPAPKTPHWDYGAEHGPAEWGSLCPEFSSCGSGRSQSPIDLSGAAREELAALKTAYRPAALRIVHHMHVADVVNNGHTVQVNCPSGSSLDVDGGAYELLQFHFHSPSEHTLEGKHFPMEMHLVHKAADGKLAVVGVFIAEGATNAAFEPVWSNLPEEKGLELHLEDVEVDVEALLPKNRTTYRYDGSLTTPPCTEGVEWFVLAEPIALGPEQIGAFRAVLQGNNRPTQPLNGRKVVTDHVVVKEK
jgi:carbonic anhydrase